MGVPGPVSQMWAVSSYVIRQKLKGRKQYPARPDAGAAAALQSGLRRLRQNPISRARAEKAAYSRGMFPRGGRMRRPGGQHPRRRAADASADRRNRRTGWSRARSTSISAPTRCCWPSALHEFTPSKYLSFSVHMDGQREHHDFSVCREGTYDKAVEGIRMALERGFRVTTNTTLFDGADPQSVRQFFDDMMELGVEGMMLSPGYTYDKAPDQEHFLTRKKTRNLFRQILSNRSEKWTLQPEPAVPGIPDGQARLQMHALGNAHLQHLRLAEALLPAAGRLRRHFRRADARNRTGKITAPRAAIRSARTAWFTAAMKPAP